MSGLDIHFFGNLYRPLDAAAQEEMRALSSRAEVTATTARYSYNYGSFRGDPEALLRAHFDFYFHASNYGERRLMFKFPLEQVQALRPLWREYTIPDKVEVKAQKPWLILSLDPDPEDGERGGWLGEDQFDPAQLMTLWKDIAQGDLIPIFLAWLSIIYLDQRDPDIWEAPGPPIPPNLGALSDPQLALVDFFEPHSDALDRATALSPTAPRPSEPDWEAALAQLSPEALRHWLGRFLAQDALAYSELRQLLNPPSLPVMKLGPRPKPMELFPDAG